MASEKFKALVHYVVASADDPHRLGATRLNKICWYADTLAYRYGGKTITGETYIKRTHGPVPKSILATIRELEAEQKIHVRDHQLFQSRKMRLFQAMEDADASVFDEDERGIIDFVVARVCHDHTAASISELTHDAVWEAANDGEEIPMSATLVSEPAEFTEKVSAWALKVVEKAAGKRNAA